MHSNRYTLIFTTIVTLILGFSLSQADASLKTIINDNVNVDIKKNMLSSLGFEPTAASPWTNENVESIFNNSIISFVVDTLGNIAEDISPNKLDPKIDSGLYPIYKKVINGETEGFAIPISGKGLWGTMYGYFAINADGSSAKGITFYKHKETPGLGGEVDKPWFKNNFIGKRFVDRKGSLIGIQTVKGKVDLTSKEAYHQVDGISGATITSRSLNEFLLLCLKRYDPFLSKIRNSFSDGSSNKFNSTRNS